MEQEIDKTEPQKESPLALLLRYSQSPNLVDDLDHGLLTKIGKDAVKNANDDDGSRDEWRKRSEQAMDLALQVVKEKTFPWSGASNVKYPLVTVAALQFHARCYPAVVQGNQVVKGQVTGADHDGRKNAQAKRVAQYMNYQILEEMTEWDEQMDKLILALPIEGCEFKKTYYDPSLKRNVSEWIRPCDFIVDYKTKDITTCPRQTHRLRFYPQEITERQRMGVWSDVDLNISQTDSEDEVLQEFYEQRLLIDLDDDGYKEPYCVTVHVDSEKVVRIKAAYYPEGITVKVGTETANLKKLLDKGIPPEMLLPVLDQQGAKIAKITKADYFTKYAFIPSPDGGFYDIGFGQLIGPLTDSVDTTINQMLDAGTLSNLGGGFVRDGVSINRKRGPVKFTMGEFKQISLPANMPIRDGIMQMQFPGPSPVLFNLLGMLIQGVKDVTGVQDIFTGGKGNQETATTTMARVEQGMQVFSAVYKRIYRSMKQEFSKLYKLNGLYLDPEVYFQVIDSKEMQQIGKADFQNDGTDVQPVADPQVSTTIQKMAKAEMLMGMKGDPGLNADEINKRFLEALEIPNYEALVVPADQRKAPPDPKFVELQMKAIQAQGEANKVKAETSLIYAKAIEAIANAESKELGPQLAQYKSELDTLRQTNDQGRNAGMEGGPVDQGGIGSAQGAPSGMPSGMPQLGEPVGPEPIGDGMSGGVPQGQV